MQRLVKSDPHLWDIYVATVITETEGHFVYVVIASVNTRRAQRLQNRRRGVALYVNIKNIAFPSIDMTLLATDDEKTYDFKAFGELRAGKRSVQRVDGGIKA